MLTEGQTQATELMLHSLLHVQNDMRTRLQNQKIQETGNESTREFGDGFRLWKCKKALLKSYYVSIIMLDTSYYLM